MYACGVLLTEVATQSRPWVGDDENVELPGHVGRYASISKAVLAGKRPKLYFKIHDKDKEQNVLSLIKDTYKHIVNACCEEDYLSRPRSDEVLESLIKLRDFTYKRTKGMTRQKSFAERAMEWLGGQGKEDFETRKLRRETIVKKKKRFRFSQGVSRQVSVLTPKANDNDRRRSLKSKRSSSSSSEVGIELNEAKNAKTSRKESTDSIGTTVMCKDGSRNSGFHQTVKVKSIVDVHSLFDENSTGSTPPSSPEISPRSSTQASHSSDKPRMMGCRKEEDNGDNDDDLTKILV
jgi:hypothetical protein